MSTTKVIKTNSFSGILEEEWRRRLENKLRELGISVDELFTVPFRWEKLVEFLSACCSVAEEAYPNSNVDKTELVMFIWKFYDTEYDITQKLDGLIDFKKIFGSAIGSIIEMFDEKVLVKIVELIIIPLLVAKLFPHKQQ